MDATFENVAVERLVKAAKVVRAKTKRKLAAQIGRGKTTGINHEPTTSKGYVKRAEGCEPL